MWKPKSKFRAEHGDERPASPGPTKSRPGDDDEDTVGSLRSKNQNSGGKRAGGYDPRMLAKIETALEKYEQDTWQKLLKEEEEFLKGLFKQFDKTGKGEELDAMAYHQMLAKWFPLASWCSSGKFRAPDTLAVIKYLKEKKDGPTKKAPEEKDKAEGGEKKEDAEIPSLSYGLWLDVVNGKYRPENPK
jgi:hypothetical protein